MTKTIEAIKEMARADVRECCEESGSAESPVGGWVEWLINGVGSDELCRLFGESPEENETGWTPAMEEKMVAYEEAAVAAAEELASEWED